MVDGKAVDLEIDCGRWNASGQPSVISLGDEPWQSDDINGDGLRFSWSHVPALAEAGSAMATDATLLMDGQTIQIGPAFRAEDDTMWVVGDDQASFEGTSGAAGDIPVSLTLDCAPRSAQDQGYVGRVTGRVDGIDVDLPLSCATWDDDSATQEFTPPESDIRIEVFVMRQNGQGTVTVETDDTLYQMVAMGDRFVITDDTVGYANTFRRDDDTTYDVSLTFDCSNRASLAPDVAIAELAPPRVVAAGEAFTVSVAEIPAKPGDIVAVTDGGAGWLGVAIRGGDDVTLNAPEAPGTYQVDYFPSGTDAPSARMELVVR